jgi:phage shock protein PspC (stress-responsive transcriptional regulator)
MQNGLVCTNQRWLRSSQGILAGVCAGIGRRFGIDPWLVRCGWLVSICVFGTGILGYAILAFCLPREDDPVRGQQRRLLGVCLKISQRTGVDVGLVRALAVVLSIASFGLTILGYFVLNFVLADEHDSLVL